MDDRQRGDPRRDRALSVTVNYAMTLMIATLLIGGLLVSTGGLLETQTERAAREELDIVGQTLAANLMSADRMVDVARRDAGEVDDFNESSIDVRIDVTLPDRVAGTTYSISVHNGSATENPKLVLRSNAPEIEVTVLFVADHLTDEDEQLIRGGDVEIHTVNGTLEVRNQ